MVASLSSQTVSRKRGRASGSTTGTIVLCEDVEDVVAPTPRVEAEVCPFDGSGSLGPPEHKYGATKSQNNNAGIPSVRSANSREITSASVELCDTADWALLTAPRGAKLRGPTNARNVPDVLLLVVWSPAKSASANNMSRQFCRGSPMVLDKTMSFVPWM